MLSRWSSATVFRTMPRVTARTLDAAQVNSTRAVWLAPLVLIGLLCAMTLLPRIQASEALILAFVLAAGSVSVLLALVAVTTARGGAVPQIKVVVRRAHWVQACMHLCVFVYWGVYWEPVFQHAPLILGQLLFVHAFEMCVHWLRDKPWTLGFGRFPIIFSTNLFLWFRDEVFLLQFVMIAFGVLAKEFLVWSRDGKRTHICNPSAISLSVASVLLLATGNTDLSWGPEISNTLNRAPHMYAWIFGLGLVVQYLFRVTLVTLSAAVALFLFGTLHFAATGVYFFLTSDIPIAVFLGLHLLVTDPSTSPRTNRGKAIFGASFGLSVVLLFELLDAFGAPTFYDKLLAVPLLNLSVRWIDRISERIPRGRRQNGTQLGEARMNLVFMSIWIVLFAIGLAGGRFGSSHPGRDSAFWERACEAEGRNACSSLVALLEPECDRGNSLACGKIGFLYHEGRRVPADPEKAYRAMNRSCELGSSPACKLLNRMTPAPTRE